MNIDIYSEKNDFFSILLVSFIFHLAVIIAFAVTIWLRPVKKDPPPIPFFEMINVAPPPPAPPAPKSKPIEKPTPPEPPPPEPTPLPKPEPKPQLKPEPKPVPKPETKPAPTPTPPEPKPIAPPMDMPMDLPSDIKSRDMEMPALRTMGNVVMDPQLQAYLNTLVKLIYQNFNPPSGTEISKGTKSTVQFRISRNGEVSEVILRTSSGNSIWDRLAVRAVQITKPPPLPPSYTAENLPLIFDFREK